MSNMRCRSLLYNVVALVHSYDTLKVRLIEKQAEDPFLRFRTLFITKMVDASHRPLLYGPYVIYRSLDGSWYRVMYDAAAPVVKELIKVPFKAGWTLVSVKNANWRYWTVVLRAPREEHQAEEYILFAGGLARPSDQHKISLIATCVHCGENASHL